MKSLQDIRTKLNGKYAPVAFAAAGIVFSIAIAVLVGHHLEDKAQKAEQEIVLTKDRWHCFAGILNEDSVFECMIYKRKDVDFGAHSGPRHREHNKKQGTPVHTQ